MQSSEFGNSAAVPYRRETFITKKIVLDFDAYKKAEVLGLHFGCSFLFVLGIDSLYFLFYEFEIVFELHLLLFL